MKYRIILASASKRRSNILKECRIPHIVVASNITEKMDHKKGARFNVLHNAHIKARGIADRYKDKDAFVIGADTIVLLDPSFKRNRKVYPLGLGKRLIGKPKTKKEARMLLKAFSGKTILVYTGICVIDSKRGRLASGVDVSKVNVKKLSIKEVDKFIKIAGPYDKAGGFSIEGNGAFIFDNIEGSFYNILGLPMMKLDDLFKKLGADILSIKK